MSRIKERKVAETKKEVSTLFGVETVDVVPKLRDRYAYPPVNIILTGSGDWTKRQSKWRQFLKIGDVGIQNSEILKQQIKDVYTSGKGIGSTQIAKEAVFDPFLLHVLADWYCPIGGKIIDTFNGSHVSAGVFNKLSEELQCHFTGIELRKNMIIQNQSKLDSIFINGEKNYTFLHGDSDSVLDDLVFEEYDWYNSCPPYSFLVKYTKNNPDKNDLSMLDYDNFVIKYASIIKKTCALLRPGSYATFTIGQVRHQKDGYLLPFKEDTITAFKEAGLVHWNEIQMVGAFGTAGMRAENTFGRGHVGQLVNVHQNVLVFKK